VKNQLLMFQIVDRLSIQCCTCLLQLLPDAMQAESRYEALAAFIVGIAAAYGLAVMIGF
jgi:hypothetical protein